MEKIYYLKKEKIYYLKNLKKAKSDSIWKLKEYYIVQGRMLRSKMVSYVFSCNRDLTAFKKSFTRTKVIELYTYKIYCEPLYGY